MKKTLLLLSIVAVAVVCIVWALVGSVHAREKRLADGSVLRLEKLSFGKREHFEPGSWVQKFKTKVMTWLPKKWVKPPPKNSGFGGGQYSWNQVSIIHTNDDALQIWLSRFDPVSSRYQDSSIQAAEILDSHGCPFLATQTGGEGNRGSNSWSATWLTFEAFPRHDKQFHLRLYVLTNETPVADFVIANPAPRLGPAPASNVVSLPVTRRDGGLTFTLNSVTFRTNADFARSQWPNEKGPREIVPAFTVEDKGVPTQEWRLLDFDLFDSSGNFASERPPRSRFLCPEEPAWKLVAKFYGSESATGASNESWVIKGIKLPGPGQFSVIDSSSNLGGVQVTLASLCGPGDFTYSFSPPAGGRPGSQAFARPVSGSVRSDPQQKNFKSNSISNIQASFGVPHIAVNLGVTRASSFDDSVLTIHAKDNRGNECDGYEWVWNGPNEAHYIYRRADQNPAFILFDLPPGAETVDLTITVHQPRLEEFIFKPTPR